MEINKANLQTLGVAFNAAFQGGLGSADPTWQNVATPIGSTTGKNEYGWLGQLPKMREWLGDRVLNNISSHGYTIKNRDFELTVSVDRNDIADDNIGIYTPLFTEMGRSTASHPDELVWALLQAGWTTPCYDGQNFFDTSHPVLDENGVETEVANTDGGAGAPWFLIDDSRALKPIIFQRRQEPVFTPMDRLDDPNVFYKKKFDYGVDSRDNVGFGFWQFAWGSMQTLDDAHYGAARAALRGIKGDGGKQLGIRPKLLVVGPSNEKAGLQLLNAERDAAGASNVWMGTARLLVCEWLE